MFNFTHNNHLKHFIDGKLFEPRTSKFQQYTTDVGTIDVEYYAKSNYNEELKRVAQLQYNDLGKDLLLFISGGTDSEIMARSFVNQGLRPKCIIISFIGGHNLSEVNEAVAVASELSLPYEIIDFDVKNFYLSGEADQLAVEVGCELLAFLVFYKVAKNLSAASVLGGELLLEKYRDSHYKPQWVLRNLETYEASHVRFANKFNIPFIIEWFSYTPELMLYYLENPEVLKLATTPNIHWSITPVKNTILRKLIPELRVKQKTTGYENLHALLTESKIHLATLMPENIGDSHAYLTYQQTVNKLKGI